MRYNDKDKNSGERNATNSILFEAESDILSLLL